MAVEYDLVIVGSGGGAFAAAIHGRRLGARVLMIERGTVGGTCVNVGCIPSKALLAAAQAYHTARSHPFAGLPTRGGPVDLAALIAQKDDLIADMRQHKYVDLADSYGFEILDGEAHFTSLTTVAVDGREISAHAYVIATGADPHVPPLPGLADAG